MMRQSVLIAGFALRAVAVSRMTLVFLAFVALGAVVLVDSIVGPVEALEDWFAGAPGVRSLEPALSTAVAGSPHLSGLVAWVTDGDAARSTYLLHDQPAILTGIVLVLLMWVPLLAALSSFDQTAGDVGSRWLRFVVFRAGRGSVFLGRFMAAAILLAGVLGVLVLSVTLYLDWRIGLYPGAALAGWGLQGYLALVALALPHVALCAWVSAANRSALRALTACVLVVTLPIAALGVAASQHELPRWVTALHPWGWKYALLDPEPATRLSAFLAMAVFTAMLSAAGAVTFARRDV